MTVTFKNSPQGKATTTKKVTSGGTVIADTQSDETVQMPAAAGPTVSWGDELSQAGEGMTLIQGAPKPPAEVGFSGGFTKGLPNYSAARVDITLKLPCQADEIDEAYEFAENWVTTRLQKQFDEV
jgi:hypothetical protein